MFSSLRKAEKSLCLMLNWSRRHSFTYDTKTWNLWFSFSKVFTEKNIKYILQEMIEEWIESTGQQQLQVIMY